VVAQIVAASTSGNAYPADQRLKRPVHRQDAACNRHPISQQGRRWSGHDRLTAEQGTRPGRQSGGGRRVDDGKDARRAFRGDCRTDERGVHVRAVTDDLRGNLVGLKHRSDQPRRPVVEPRHPLNRWVA
jgi:hypothetical protein